MRYLDTSLVVALLTPEVHSERTEAWFTDQAAGSLCVSGWVATEVSSALSIKLRTEALTLDRRAAALAGWKALRESSLLTLGITDDHLELAAEFANRHDLGLRSGDALHLAIVSGTGNAIATLDTGMALAAAQLGIPVEPL